jgi:hypothetical protein
MIFEQPHRYEEARADAVHHQDKFECELRLGGNTSAPLKATAHFRGKGSLECDRKSLTVRSLPGSSPHAGHVCCRSMLLATVQFPHRALEKKKVS